MFRLTGLIVGALIGVYLARSFLMQTAPFGGDLARGGIAVSLIAAAVCGLGGYIVGGIIDAASKKKPKDS
jgi:ABC-type uncharacterized transport system permease subunit